MIIKEYFKPTNLKEAYSLVEEKNAVIFGGGAFVRLGAKEIDIAMDLTNLNLDFIEEKEDIIEIGSMTTLRKIEIDTVMKNNFSGMVSDAAAAIMGVQLRNIATVGGTVYGKYGFSDFNTALLALDTYVELFKGGRVSLKDFLQDKKRVKDIVTKIIIKKDNRKAVFQSLRNTSTDYAILNVAVSRVEKKFNIAVGARPSAATLALKAMVFMGKAELNEESAARAGEIAAENLNFGNDLRGSAEYRKEVCKVLVKRAIMEVI